MVPRWQFSSLHSGLQLVFVTKSSSNLVTAVYMLITILFWCSIQSACCRLSPIPPKRQELVQRFVIGYMQKVKDCYLAGTGSGTLVISCSSSEILSGAITALEQVMLLIPAIARLSCICWRCACNSGEALHCKLINFVVGRDLACLQLLCSIEFARMMHKQLTPAHPL